MVVGQGGGWGVTSLTDTAAELMSVADNDKLFVCILHSRGVVRRQTVDMWLKTDAEGYFHVL